MNILQDHQEKSLVKKIFSTFLVFFILQLFLGSFLIYQVALKQTTDYLQRTTKRVQEDISYQNGKWDTHRYNADPNVPDTYPLYILSADGYVIDRWKPLHGFLDTSDVKRLVSYETPQNITTPTNQTWRMLSQPIMHNTDTLGIITVAYFNPPVNPADIDRRLAESIATIQSKIQIKNGNIDTTNLDVRDISFDIAFQVVDKFNRISTKNNNTNSIDRIPNYIDTSYIGSVINTPPVRQIHDGSTNENFQLVTTPILDNNNYVVGVIVIGRSIEYIQQILLYFAIAEAALGVILVTFFSLLSIKITRTYVSKIPNTPVPLKPEIQHISFDKKSGSIMLDENEVHIPYATNQYYLCEALFSAPKKRWEVDELLEKFGEQDLTNWRKVYDAMIIINKKVAPILGTKLIIAQEKTYHINSSLTSKIS